VPRAASAPAFFKNPASVPIPPARAAQASALSHIDQDRERHSPRAADAPRSSAGTPPNLVPAAAPRRPAPTHADFKAAARAVTVPAPRPALQKTKLRGGGDARRFSTASIVDDYLALCRDPLSDLQRWLDEDKKKPSTPRIPQQSRHATHTASLAAGRQFPRDTLHEMSGRVRANDLQGSDRRDMPGGPGAGAGQHRQLQQVQAGRNLGSGQAAHAGSGGEISAIGGYYAALIAAARATLRPHEAVAMVRNLMSQKVQAIRAAQDRMRVARANLRNACRNRDLSHLGGQRLG